MNTFSTEQLDESDEDLLKKKHYKEYFEESPEVRHFSIDTPMELLGAN